MGGSTPAVTYNTQLMAEDMAANGWLKTDLAKRARTTAMTVGRFLSGKSQTPKTAKKLAKALGYEVRRYVVPAGPVRPSSDRRPPRERRRPAEPVVAGAL